MTSFVLKIIAMFSMFCDHFSDASIGYISILNYIGRIAFPIFAFQISEGYLHTKNLKKYIIRLMIFALISEIPFYLFVDKYLSNPGLNVMCTLLLGLVCIVIYDSFSKWKNEKLSFKFLGLELKQYIALFLVICIAFLGDLVSVDYGFWGIIVIFTFYFFRDNKLKMLFSFIILCFIKYGITIYTHGFYLQYVFLGLSTMLSSVFIGLYNGKQGLKVKYLLYLFYPVHLLALYFLC